MCFVLMNLSVGGGGFPQEQVAMAQAETARLRAAAVHEAAARVGLEQSADELEAKYRAATAAEEDSR